MVAKSDVECYIVEKEAFQQILEEKPELAGIISEILTHRQVTLEGTNFTPSRSHDQAVQKIQLVKKIAAFFGIKSRRRSRRRWQRGISGRTSTPRMPARRAASRPMSVSS